MRPSTCGESSLESEFGFGRTSETRKLAERALGRLLDALDRDVDLLVNVVVDADADLVALESALGQAKFEADSKQPDGWRWHTTIEGLAVKVDLLCDLETVGSEMTVRPSGCEQLGVYNLRGTGYVARDFTWEQIVIGSGSEELCRTPFASLGSPGTSWRRRTRRATEGSTRTTTIWSTSCSTTTRAAPGRPPPCSVRPSGQMR